jgi:hypothetical protein
MSICLNTDVFNLNVKSPFAFLGVLFKVYDSEDDLI